jgi:glycine cleavage system H protein
MHRDRDMHVPRDRHYDRSHHLWALRDARTGLVRIGIDAIGLESLGELAYVALSTAGQLLARGTPLGSLEAAKMTSTIAAPVGGKIVARNEAVLADPLLVNRDPYGAGWLVEIEPSRWPSDSAQLVSGDAIGPWSAAEIEKLRSEDSGSTGNPELPGDSAAGTA